MTTLREARERGTLADFIKEREAEQGDAAALDRAVSAMAGKAKHKPVPEKPE